MNRAYSILTIKAVDEEKRVLRGTATTPEPDRLGDIVEPLGVKFKNPMPLLWQHRSSEPIGQVKFDKPTKDGITFEAHMPVVAEPGKLKDRIDEAWQSVKLGLVRAVSIGFRAIEFSFMKETDGIRFTETEVMELSLVTIPANAEAMIESFKGNPLLVCKSIDGPLLAASGLTIDRPKPPASRDRTQPVKPKEGKVKTIKEQIEAFEAKRAVSAARMDELMSKAADDLATLSQEDSEEYDGLEVEVKKIDEHIARLKKMEATNKAKAAPVENPRSPEQATEQRRSTIISVKANVPPATAFVRYCMASAAARGNRWEAQNIAKQWHDQTPEVELALSADLPAILKAAVGAGTTTDATWASPLVAFQVMAGEFIELLRPATIIGRIPGLRRVPFNIQMPRTTTGSTVGWVGENAPKPVSAMAFDTVTLRWAKAAGIVVLTDELVRFSNPSAEAVVRQDLIDAVAQFLDRQFVDPSVAEITNVSPASITNGVTAVSASGTTAAAFRADVKSLFAAYFAANLSTAGGVWIMTSTMALSLSLMMNSLGQPVFPEITANGGVLLGYPVITSENIPATGSSPVDGYPIIFVVPREVMLADDGQVVIDASNQASVQMDTAPDSPPSASTNMVSLWQMNMTGLRAERWINWKKRRSAAAQYIQNAKYSE